MTGQGGKVARLIAVAGLALAGGCGLVLDATPRDAGPPDGSMDALAEPLDAPGLDAPGLDAPAVDAPRPDAARPDAPPPDAWLPDAPGLDAPPPDAFVEPEPDAGTCDPSTCRAAGPCEQTFCDGTICRRVPLARGMPCNPSRGECDVAELCDGVSALCPPDRRHGPGTICRGDPTAPCDPEERCDGVNDVCPPDIVGIDHRRLCEAGAGFCAVASGVPVCVTADLCSLHEGRRCFGGCAEGLIACTMSGSVECAGAVPVTDGRVCRPRTGLCDAEERCLGTRSCPTDILLGTTTVCRPSAGPCDVEERCTASSPACPRDELRGPTEVCLAGGCQLCTGESPACDGPVRVAGTCAIGVTTGVCAASGECLTGSLSCVLRDQPCLVGVISDLTCGSAGFAPAMTPCGAPTQCTDAPMCNGSGICRPPVVLTGAPCRAWCRGFGVVEGTCSDVGLCDPDGPCPIP
jgi:hypothetical protein